MFTLLAFMSSLMFVYSTETQVNSKLSSIKLCVELTLETRDLTSTVPITTFQALVSPQQLITDASIPAVEMINLLSMNQIRDILLLERCISQHSPENMEERSYYDIDSINYIGGNNVTYLTGYLDELLPNLRDDLISKLSDVVALLKWKDSVESLGIRCIELLRYQTGGKYEFHIDDESIYTLSLAISDDFEGGEIEVQYDDQLESDGTYMQIKTKLNGGVLIKSEHPHAVKPILSGNRVVLVIEFWDFPDAPLGYFRPDSDEMYDSGLCDNIAIGAEYSAIEELSDMQNCDTSVMDTVDINIRMGMSSRFDEL